MAWFRRQKTIGEMLLHHLGCSQASDVKSRQVEYPVRVLADAQRGWNEWLSGRNASFSIIGIPVRESFFNSTSIATLLAPSDETLQPSSLEYNRITLGDESSVELIEHGLWLAEIAQQKLGVLWTISNEPGGGGIQSRLRISLAFAAASQSTLVDDALAHIDSEVRGGRSLRGGIVSLDGDAESLGIRFHKLRMVNRDEVVLPEETIRLLDRNVIRFVEQRPALRKAGLSTRKGLLFYGPPGTGKTHTIHYLIAALKGHTTFLITAEQIGNIDEYIKLARLLQPSVVVIEDVDLIARSRAESSVCEQSVLNKLLNEMDGLREDADLLFLLTTNRPEALEAALADRPGRVDQAIEFPLPDAPRRAKLVRLYAGDLQLDPEVVDAMVRRTEGTSAAFIKELLRRSMQFALEVSPDASPGLSLNDVEQALDEMLLYGGSINRAMLGFDEVAGGN